MGFIDDELRRRQREDQARTAWFERKRPELERQAAVDAARLAERQRELHEDIGIFLRQMRKGPFGWRRVQKVDGGVRGWVLDAYSGPPGSDNDVSRGVFLTTGGELRGWAGGHLADGAPRHLPEASELAKRLLRMMEQEGRVPSAEGL